jgi:hypothetical protein
MQIVRMATVTDSTFKLEHACPIKPRFKLTRSAKGFMNSKSLANLNFKDL